jgi:hypothetical protein
MDFQGLLVDMWGQDSMVSIVTRLNSKGIVVQFLAEESYLSFLQSIQTHLPIPWIWVTLPSCKAAGT